ncbi:Gp15 family bacteriophage protein, partial [Dysosmobacter welbionis]
GLVGVSGQGGGEVDHGQPQARRLGKVSVLVPGLRALRQFVPPHLRRGGDQPQIHGDVRLLRQLGDVIQVRLLQAVRRGVHLGDQCFAFTEIDVVEQPFADQLLRPGLQARPLVPQGKLVLDVGLHVLHIAAVQHAGQSQCRPLLEGAVLHVGPLPVRQEHLPHHQPPQKEAEHRCEKSCVSFG